MIRGAPARQRATSGIEATRTQPVTLSSTSRDHIQNVQTAPTTSDIRMKSKGMYRIQGSPSHAWKDPSPKMCTPEYTSSEASSFQPENRKQYRMEYAIWKWLLIVTIAMQDQQQQKSKSNSQDYTWTCERQQEEMFPSFVNIPENCWINCMQQGKLPQSYCQIY